MNGDQIREELEGKVFQAVNELLRVTGAEACALPIPGSDPMQYVAIGSAERILGLLIPGADEDEEPTA